MIHILFLGCKSVPSWKHTLYVLSVLRHVSLHMIFKIDYYGRNSASNDLKMLAFEQAEDLYESSFGIYQAAKPKSDYSSGMAERIIYVGGWSASFSALRPCRTSVTENIDLHRTYQFDIYAIKAHNHVLLISMFVAVSYCPYYRHLAPRVEFPYFRSCGCSLSEHFL